MNIEYMNLAIDLAKEAYKRNEIPVGCVIEKNGKVIATAFNTKESENCIISHAEIKAIIEASNKIGDWRLNDCILYTTLFPCPMCASAIQQSRISKIYYILDNNNEDRNMISNNIFNLNKDFIAEKVNIKFPLIDEFFKKLRSNDVSRETLKSDLNNM